MLESIIIAAPFPIAMLSLYLQSVDWNPCQSPNFLSMCTYFTASGFVNS